MALAARHLAAFTALVDTLLPAVAGDGPAWTTSGASLGFASRLPDVHARLPHDRHRADLERFLGLLATRAGGTLLYGRPRPFPALAAYERADAFRAMESHRLSVVRAGAASVKTLVAFLWVTTDDASAPPPSWRAMGYPGPDGPPPAAPRPLPIVTVAGDTSLTCDVAVVGSGAGGATAAGVLATAGLDVVVLEAGGYRSEADFTHLEAEAYRDLYLDGALNGTADGSMTILAGATLGGGTVINYTTSFPTPPRVRREWDAVAGFRDVFTGEQFEESLGAVSRRLEVNRRNGWPSARAQLLEKGLGRLGWHVAEMPRNADGCTREDCGYCTMGCRIGAKRSMPATYLRDAADAGARLVPAATVETVVVESGRATGVVARCGEWRLRVHARAVVLAAGALHTPAILLRSRIGGKAAGRYLRLHPVTAVWGRFAERVDPWTGILQTRYSDEFADLEGEGYGFRFETAPIHPLFPAAFIGWEDGASFKRDVLGLGHLSVAGILLRDQGHGRVVLRRDGTPLWKYSIGRRDQSHVREGVRRGAQVLEAAGAEEIVASSMRPVRWRPGDGRTIDDFRAEADAAGYGPNRTRYMSFHQMGSARMGRDPGESVVGETNEAHGTAGLFVMDGSCFPTASGVNPMLTIAAIAHRGATLLADRLA